MLRPGRALAIVFFLAAISSAGACGRSRVDQRIEQFDAALSVLDDGSVEVEERLQVYFGGTPSTRFRRNTPVWRYDGIQVLSASMDGRESQHSDDSGEVRIGKGPALDVQWQFAPISSGTHTFVLKYRAKNAVEISGIRGMLSWRVFAPRDYNVDSASVKMTLPAGAVLIGDPWVEEAGWSVTRRADGMNASRHGIGAFETATSGMTFTIDTMKADEPLWQYHARRAKDLMPAFVTTGACLVVVGIGVAWLVRFKIASGLADRERVDMARDLRRAGVATVLFAALAAAGVAYWLSPFGIWPWAVPAGILFSGVLFIWRARRWRF